ncbi:MAG: hypothetical protein M3N14_06270 [Bacteroidota bacterium]|nr:hypothetical protein [Bacteroidota bacterium]
MKTNGSVQQLKQAYFIFWLNLAFAVFALAVFIKSIGGNVQWKILCSGIGFIALLTLTLLLLMRVMQLRKK